MSTCATVSMAGLASASVRASPVTVLQPLCQPVRLVQAVSAGFGCDVTQIARSGAAIGDGSSDQIFSHQRVSLTLHVAAGMAWSVIFALS